MHIDKFMNEEKKPKYHQNLEISADMSMLDVNMSTPNEEDRTPNDSVVGAGSMF